MTSDFSEVKVARSTTIHDAWVLLQRLIVRLGLESPITHRYHVGDIFLRIDEPYNFEKTEEILVALGIQVSGAVDTGIIKLKNAVARASEREDPNYSVSRTVYGQFSCQVTISHGQATIAITSGIQRAAKGSAMLIRTIIDIMTHIVPEAYTTSAKVNVLITDLSESNSGAEVWKKLDCCKSVIQDSEHPILGAKE